MVKVIKVDVRNPFDPNASAEQWEVVGRRILEIANEIDPDAPIVNPFPEGGCVICP